MRRWWLYLAAVATALAIIFQWRPPKQVVVEGRATIGGKPIDGGLIQLVAVGRQEKIKPALTDKDGRFRIAVRGGGAYRALYKGLQIPPRDFWEAGFQIGEGTEFLYLDFRTEVSGDGR